MNKQKKEVGQYQVILTEQACMGKMRQIRLLLDSPGLGSMTTKDKRINCTLHV